MQKKIYILGSVILSTALPSLFGEDSNEMLNQAYAKAISGDVRSILTYLDSTDDTSDVSLIELREKYKNRFVTNEERFEFEDTFIFELHKHYTSYWRTSLLNPDEEPIAREELFGNLRHLVKNEGRESPLSSINELEATVVEIGKENGLLTNQMH